MSAEKKPAPPIIRVMPSPWWFGSGVFIHPSDGKVHTTDTGQLVHRGDVITLIVHELKCPLEARRCPRVRVLEEPRRYHVVPCALLDEWPNPPEFWPPHLAPGASSNPGHPSGTELRSAPGH